MYDLVMNKQLDELRSLGLHFQAEGNLAHSLSSLDAALSEVPNFKKASLTQILEHLADVEVYSSLVKQLATTLNVSDLPTRRLLGLMSEEDSSEISVLPTSPLYYLLPGSDSADAKVVPVATLPSLASSFLVGRLDDFMFLTSEALESAQGLYPPCLAHAFKTAGCSDAHCLRQHTSPDDLSSAALQQRVDTIHRILGLLSSTLEYTSSVLKDEAENATKRRAETT